MRRLTATLIAACALAVPATADAARTDDAAKPIVFLTGGETNAAVDCESAWGRAIPHLRGQRVKALGKTMAFTGQFETVSNYDTDKNCDVVLTGGAGQGLENQARAFAKWLRDNHSAKGETVDVVAHGTGGLVLRYALAMAAQGAAGWPAPLVVEDAITLGTPHGGGTLSGCARQVCHDVNPGTDAGKAMIAKLATPPFMNPQGAGGTDWTAIAAKGDTLVTAESALAMDAGHETTYLDDKLTHAGLLADNSKARNAVVTYQHRGTDVIEWRKAPHVLERVGLNLVFGTDGYATTPGTNGNCTGSNDQTGGGVVVQDPGLPSWKGGREQLSYVRSGVMEAYATCFKKASGGKLTSDGVVRMNGVDITPAAGTLITIDPAKRQITAPNMSMTLPTKYFGAVPIPIMSDTDLSWTLPKEAGTLTDGDIEGFNVARGGKIAGLSLKGTAKVSFGQGTIQLEATLGVPGIFSGSLPRGDAYIEKPQCSNGLDDDKDGKFDFPKDEECATANDNYENGADGPGFGVTLATGNTTGIKLDKISGQVEGNLRLGSLKVGGGASFSYSLADNSWEASLTVIPPIPSSPTFKVGAGVKDGRLNALSGEVTNINKGPLFAGMFLQRFKVGVVFTPWEVTIGTGFSWGARVHTSDGPIAAAEVDGDITVSGTALKLSGKLLLMGAEWGSGSAEYKYGESLALQATLGRTFEAKKTKGKVQGNIKTALTGTFKGNFDAKGADLEAKGGACFEGELKFYSFEKKVESKCLGQATMRGSVKKNLFAFTVCGQVDLGVWTGAIGYGIKSTFENGKTVEKADIVEGSCDVEEWHTAPASAAQAGGERSLSVGSADAVVLGIEGQGAAPHVALRGPDGAAIPAPAAADGIVRGKGYMLIHSSADATTYVVIGKPEAGRWTIAPQPGSAPIAEVRSADALPAPSVEATVSKARVIRYEVKPIPGQVVTFKELGPDVNRTLGTARGKKGTLRFTPAIGRGGKRRIVAVVEQGGMPRTALDVATFKAPALKTLAAPKGVKLRRKGERLTVTWKRVPGAVRYAVGVEAGDGRDLFYEVKGRKVVVKRLLGDKASKVTIRAVRADSKLGKPRTLRGGK